MQTSSDRSVTGAMGGAVGTQRGVPPTPQAGLQGLGEPLRALGKGTLG